MANGDLHGAGDAGGGGDAGARRLLFVGLDRKARTLLRFFREFGKSRAAGLKFVCSDMCRPYILKSVRAYLLKESFRLFWNYKSPYWAAWHLDKWCSRAMRSRLEPVKSFVRTLRNHRPLIMNWFKAKKAFSSGVVEGLNRKTNLVTRKAYGFRSYEVLKIALFHTMGDLPEPEFTHQFC